MSGFEALIASPEVLDGIGPERAGQLAGVGIDTVAGVIVAGPRPIEAVGTMIVGRWRAAGRLLCLERMTPAVAAALANAGVDSMSALAGLSLRQLEQRVSAMAEPPSLYELSDLLHEAWRTQGTGMLVVRVSYSGAHGDAIPGAMVRVSGQSGLTNESGLLAFGRLAPSEVRVAVQPPDVVVPYVVPARMVADRVTGPIAIRVPRHAAAARSTFRTRQSDGVSVSNRGATAVRVATIGLAELRDDSYLVVQPALSDGRVPLVSLDKERRGFELVLSRVVVSADRLPVDTAPRALVRYTGGRFEATALTPAEVTAQWLRPRQVRKRLVP